MKKEDLIIAYQNFIRKIDQNPFDFRTGKKEISFPSVNEEGRMHMQPFGSNGAGCIMVTANIENDQPVAWLDSEGYPNAVFANDIADFFSVLPFGTGTLYEMIKRCMAANNLGACKEFAEASTGQVKVNGDLFSVYEEQMGLEISQNPCETIYKAMNNYQSTFKNWLN